MEPKILVGCPTADYKAYCLDEYITALKSLTYKNCDFLIVDNSKTDDYCERIKKSGIKVIKDKYLPLAKQRIISSRNLIREYALKNNYDYFFSLEQDVIPPKDIIERLLEAKKEIIAGVYYTEYKIKGKQVIRPLMWEKVNEETLQFMTDQAETNQVVNVDVTGLGCIMISRKVLEKVKFRVEKENEAFDDLFFCVDAEKNGYKIYVDTSIKCKHLIRGMNWEKIENEEKPGKKS